MVNERKKPNSPDTYAIAVLKGNIIIGYFPRVLLRICFVYSIARGGTITCVVHGVKVDRYHFFPNTFETKYRAENFTDSDSDIDTNAYRHYMAIISHLLLYKYIYKTF